MTSEFTKQTGFEANYYSRPDALAMHLCSFAELEKNVTEAQRWTKKAGKGHALVVSIPDRKIVFDTRKS